MPKARKKIMANKARSITIHVFFFNKQFLNTRRSQTNRSK